MTPMHNGDGDFMGMLAQALSRLIAQSLIWFEVNFPIISYAGIAAFLFGKHFGYKGAALRLFVLTGIFTAIVGVPFVLNSCRLDANTYETILACGLSVFCYRTIKWIECLIVKKLGIDRRGIGEDE